MNPNNKSLLFFIGLIPTMLVMLIIGVLIRLSIEQNLTWSLILLMVIYLLPPLLWRAISPFIPTTMGSSYLGSHTESVNGWFVSYQIQQLYNALPILESILKIIPGVYSAWLRLWGAKIGEKINWTWQSKVIDRPFVHIGDRSVIGNEAYLFAHTIKKKEDRYLLYLKEISIGSDVVLALQNKVGPGAVIADRAFIKARVAVLPNTKINEGQIYE
ncbi:MAG: acyl transferase [Bacteriovorax sp.]